MPSAPHVTASMVMTRPDRNRYHARLTDVLEIPVTQVPPQSVTDERIFQARVEQACATNAAVASLLSDAGVLNPAGTWLVQVLKGQAAVTQAAHDTALAADELRKYQKFARPGQPSPHIVQLRQKQAAARQASARGKQAYTKAAMEFARTLPLTIPPRESLDSVVTRWITLNIPIQK